MPFSLNVFTGKMTGFCPRSTLHQKSFPVPSQAVDSTTLPYHFFTSHTYLCIFIQLPLLCVPKTWAPISPVHHGFTGLQSVVTHSRHFYYVNKCVDHPRDKGHRMCYPSFHTGPCGPQRHQIIAELKSILWLEETSLGALSPQKIQSIGLQNLLPTYSPMKCSKTILSQKCMNTHTSTLTHSF